MGLASKTNIVGKRVDSIPHLFKRCVYLKTTGPQYIDTGIDFVDNVLVECVALSTHIKTETYFGSRGVYSLSAHSPGISRYYTQLVKTGYLPTNEKIKILINHLEILIKDMSDDVIFRSAWWSSNTNPLQFVLSAGNIFLFKINGLPNDSASGLSIYSFNLKNNGKEVINLIPCLDANDIPCMYDTVKQKPLYNAGDGTFLYELKQKR